MQMHEIVSKILPLSKQVLGYFKKQNYRMFGVLLRSYQLSRKNKRTDFVAKHDIFKLFTHCARITLTQKVAKRNAEVLFKDAIESQNYQDGNKLLTRLEIKKSDLVIGEPLHVFPYYTDGGITYDDPNNTMLELFTQTGDKAGKDINIRPYISTKKKNITVACYMGKQFHIEKSKKVPYQWQVKDEPKEIRFCDYEKFLANKEE
jgi:hypothetical protein